MDKFMTALFGAGLIIFVLVFICLLYAIPVWLLWNWLCPLLFKLPEITLIQAWGLSFLSGLLFKSSSTSSSN